MGLNGNITRLPDEVVGAEIHGSYMAVESTHACPCVTHLTIEP